VCNHDQLWILAKKKAARWMKQRERRDPAEQWSGSASTGE